MAAFSIKDNAARPYSPSSDCGINVVVSVSNFISSVVNETLLEAEVSESLISKKFKKWPKTIIIYSQQGNFHNTTKAEVFPLVISILSKVSDLPSKPFISIQKKQAKERWGWRLDPKFKD